MIKESAELLQLYLKYLQAEEPLIHKLHDLLSEILLKLLGRIADPKMLVGITKITNESFDVKNLLPIDKINLSCDIKEAIKNCKDVVKSKLRLDYRNHFKAIALHILKKTCYNNSLIQCAKFIGPSRILDDESAENFLKLTTFLPFQVPPSIIDEWSLVKATRRSR